MRKLLTLDVGTTAVKAALFDESLSLLGSVIKEYRLLTPASGIIELDPDVYWNSVRCVVRDVMEQTGSSAEDVASITCTTQGETLIPVDQSGQALSNAIVWLDDRARKEAREIASFLSPSAFYAATGIPEINGYCPVSKLLWIKRNLPEVYNSTYKFLLLEDYLVMKLTGRFVTNPAIMCTTGYFDIRTDSIWTEILEQCAVDPQKIPDVLPCAKKISNLRKEVADALGLSCNTIVSTGAMDQVTGAIGAGNIEEGIVSETTGTAMVIAATTNSPALAELSPISVYSHAEKGKYLYVDVRQTAGIVLKWFRDEFCKDLPKETAFSLMTDMARNVPPLSRGLCLYPHFTGVQAPVPNENARGVFFGMGLDTDRACFIRAIFEGIAYELKESLEMMKLSPLQIVSMGGGSKSDVWNQIKADVLGVSVAMPHTGEAASLGAAVLGGIACGIFPNISTPVKKLQTKEAYLPDRNLADTYTKGYATYKSMYNSFLPLFDRS